MIDVLILPGTGYPFGDGISAAFAAALDPTRFASTIVRYPADYGLHTSYANSREAGRAALLDAIEAAPGRVVIAGYSQGAGIAGDVAAELAAGAHPGLSVDGCALIADPARPPGATMPGLSATDGYGIVGARAIPDRIPAWWAAAPGDPITALPAGNPLRTIADASEYFSLAGPADALAWGVSLVEHARANRWQRWWSLPHWLDWGGALTYARGYLLDGRHTSAYLAGGYCTRLAALVNQEVRP